MAHQDSNDRVMVRIVNVIRDLFNDVEEAADEIVIHACWDEKVSLDLSISDCVCV